MAYAAALAPARCTVPMTVQATGAGTVEYPLTSEPAKIQAHSSLDDRPAAGPAANDICGLLP
jgi:hypothetical protein